MPRDMFYLLRVNFYVVDILGVPGEIQKENRLWKLQPMIDMIRNHCRSLERKPRSSYSIDEQMIPFLGRCPVRQYVRNKPRPVDLKNFVLTTSEGKILDFEIYQGKLTPFENKDLGLGASVILHLSHTLPKESYLSFDRYFSTESLFDRLISLEIYGTVTIMPNRLKKCNFLKDKQFKRGNSQKLVRNDGKVSVTKWMDNKSVLMISTACGSEPQGVVSRWEKSEKKHVEVPCPNVVGMYNQKMGGVDVCDQIIELLYFLDI
ncbi:piggyBac transposable element-derived protein 3-like [Sitophilus oryzae]|uniref:PiggyBac transposable element-derived protein 3-like n=1 Tax=Sitophilus oryzae TaxID=7048 RepID=A0A6J2X7F0_SITOR|nr:piggyBac transposable element-derived protein 3-like [Sitophilus oryzae]